jgi:DHA2 family multidrug resistance protein
MSGAAAVAGGRAAAQWRPAANPWLIALVVTLAAFMEVLDTTIVNVALPHIAGTMSASNDESTWTLTSYLVANGIVLPISGWLGSVIGRKRYFIICIAMFTVCSFLCGIADSLWQLILFRLLQGFFGGGLQPNQQSIILDTFEPAKRGAAFGVTAVATIVAPVLGPTLGGWITDNYTWRWIFFINVPVGIFATIAVAQLVEDPPWLIQQAKKGVRRKIDGIGLGLIALGLGCLQIVMDRGEDEDWFSSPFIRIFAVLAAAGLVGAVIWLWTAKNPIVNLHILKDRNFAAGCLTIFAMAMVLYSSAVIIPQLAQTSLGYTATWAGLILSPGALLICFLIPIVGKLVMPNFQTRYIIMFGFFLLGIALVYSHGLSPTIDFDTLAKMRMAQTTGLAFLFVPISTITYTTLPKESNSDGAALFTMFRNVAGSIGIAAATALVTQRTQVRMAYLASHLTPLNGPYNALVTKTEETLRGMGVAPTELHTRALGHIYQTLQGQASVLAYMDIFAITATVSFCMIPLCLIFGRSRSGGAAPAH